MILYYPLKGTCVGLIHYLCVNPPTQSLCNVLISDVGVLSGCNPGLSVKMRKNLHHLLETTFSLISLSQFFCVCVCMHVCLISPLFTPSLCCSSSLSDMLPKVETRVVLVGDAGRNGALVKALQVHQSSINAEGPLWSAGFCSVGRSELVKITAVLSFISRTPEKSCQGWYRCFWVYTVNRWDDFSVVAVFHQNFPIICALKFFSQWEMLNIVRYIVNIFVSGALLGGLTAVYDTQNHKNSVTYYDSSCTPLKFLTYLQKEM